MRLFFCHVIVCAAAALAPWWNSPRVAAPVANAAFPGFPASWEGRPLQALPLSEREARFADGFPGRIGRFQDGHRELLLRWVAAPTRRLHPAAHCLRGAGFTVDEHGLTRDGGGVTWSELTAARDGHVYRVRERIHDADGRVFFDVSAWYWQALLGRSRGPWLACTILEPES